MNGKPYEGITNGELIFRDYLALDRTMLANERTLLSYVRTAIAFAGAGAALIYFSEDTLMQALGWVLIPVATLIIVTGFIRFNRMKRRLAEVSKHPESCQP
ncbi:MAG: DUF202 domain-containing protein [Dehalococcoidaceae bacterium]|nr:DUF202 domain-containing protein [Dehalococcoidaceae bacterium]